MRELRVAELRYISGADSGPDIIIGSGLILGGILGAYAVTNAFLAVSNGIGMNNTLAVLAGVIIGAPTGAVVLGTFTSAAYKVECFAHQYSREPAYRNY